MRATTEIWVAGLRRAVAAVAVAMSAYQLITAYVGTPQAEVHYPVFMMFALVVLFGTGAAESAGRGRWLAMLGDGLFIALTVVSCAYLFLNPDYLMDRFVYVEPLTDVEMVLGITLLFVILEAARRAVGWVLVWLTVIFLLYAKFGNLLPDPFWHQGFTFERIIEQSYMTPDGIWNVPIAVTANYIFLFVLLGALLVASGAGNFFTDLAKALTGRMTGGPAKTAVVASAFMGMLSGSSPANVVTTGSFTIPAMKRAGYPPVFAAGVEAVASTGGQLTPPIMGAAAFLMVEFVAVPYSHIMRFALIPAVLYFVAVFAMVDLEARRLGLRPILDEDMPGLIQILRRRGYLLLPLIVMVWLLIEGWTPTTAGFWSVVTLTALLVLLDPENRRNIVRVLYQAFTEAPRMIAPISVACAIGGVLAGVIIMTGLGVKMSNLILDAAGQYNFLALVLTMIVAVILGMGMPTAAAYIILAVLLAPGLAKLGVSLVAAHMFIIYCAAKSSITPPVAVASYAAAAISGTNPWQTSLIAFKLGLSVFIIPYMFVYSPALLAEGTPLEIAWASLTATLGVIAVSVASIGWFGIGLRSYERLTILVAALVMLYQGWLSDLVGFGLATACAVAVQLRRRRMSENVGEH